MSKYIKFTDELRLSIMREFEQSLRGAKAADGKVIFSKTLTAPDTKATLFFTPVAYTKMLMLVSEFSDEVAWHGVAFRGDDPEKHEYVVTDIMVYPQEVTGSTVNTDQEKYQTWLMEQPDEIFNHIRFQGHSHVNMATTPSSVDLTHQSRILDQLDDDMFYIFLIWNKRMEHNIKIYDLQKNLLFENGDINVALTTEGVDFTAFLAEAKSNVTRKTYTPSYPSYGKDYIGNYDRGYGGYDRNYGGCSGYSKDYSKPITKPIPASQLPAASEKKEEKKSEPSKVVDLRPRTRIDETWEDIWDRDHEVYGQQYLHDSEK